MKLKFPLTLIRYVRSFFAFFIISSMFSGFAFGASQKQEVLRVGVTPGPSELLLKTVSKTLEQKYNLTLKTYVFNDYQIPNEALNSGDLDANIFQTQEFLDNSISEKKYKIRAIANTFIYPMGIYSKKIKTLAQLKKNGVVLIPNDASNRARAHALLKEAGLTQLKIIEMNAAQIGRSVPDADIVVLNNDFVLMSGFKFTDALFQETPSSSAKYINVVAVRTDAQKTDALEKLVSVLHSKEFEFETYKYYPGAVKSW